jgi:O-antigen/teichoic acid export membrane protein
MSQIAKKSAEIFSVRVISVLSAVIVGVLVARAVGPYGKGLYAYAVLLLGIVTTLAIGQSAAIAWEYARRKRDAHYVSRSMTVTTILLGLPIGIAFALYGFYSHNLAFIVTGCVIPIVFYDVLVNSMFISIGDVRLGNIQSLIATAVVLAGVASLMVTRHATLPLIMLVWACGYTAAFVYSVWRVMLHLRAAPRPTQAYSMREQWAFGFKNTLNAVIGYVNFRIDAYILAWFLGNKALGIYSLGIGIGELLWQVSRPVAAAAFARIGQSSQQEAAVLTARCVRHTLLMVAGASALLFFIGPWLVTFVYGQAFAAAGDVLRWLLPGIIGYCVMPLFGTFFTQQLGKPTVGLAVTTTTLVICASLAVILIPVWGLVGGAISTSFSYVVGGTIMCVLFSRANKMPIRYLVVPTRDDLGRYVQFARAVATRAKIIEKRAA